MKTFLVSLSFLVYLSKANQFSAFSDNECKNPIKLGSTQFNDGNEYTGLEIRNSITDSFHAYGAYYDDVTFPGANTTSDTGTAKKVYWSVPQPDRTCSYLLMKQFDRNADHTVLPLLPGELIITARKQGCYYSSLDDHTSLVTSYCCGTGDCKPTNLQVGKSSKRSIIPQASAQVVARKPMSHVARASKRIQGSKNHEASAVDSNEYSTHSRKRDPALPKCNVVSLEAEDYWAIGQQIAITSPVQCGSAGCTFKDEKEVSYSTAISNTQEFSLSMEEGVTASLETGATFLGSGVTASAGIEFSTSQSWTTTTGQEVTNENASTTGVELALEPGTTGFLAFLPNYRCWTGQMHCEADNGNWHEATQSYCVPNGGTYGIVYTSLGSID